MVGDSKVSLVAQFLAFPLKPLEAQDKLLKLLVGLWTVLQSIAVFPYVTGLCKINLVFFQVNLSWLNSTDLLAKSKGKLFSIFICLIGFNVVLY